MLADLPPFPDPDPERDLVLDAHLEARPEALWRAWTEAELLCRWFCPPPWRVSAAVIEPAKPESPALFMSATADSNRRM